MHILAGILSLLLVLDLQAATTVESLLENYNYSLNVEWDQKDDSFREKLSNDFVQAVVKSQISSQELLALVAKKNPAQLEGLRLQLLNLSSPEAISKELIRLNPSLYSKGASWNGQALLYSGGMLLILAVAIYTITSGKEQVCAQTSVGDNCRFVSPDQVICGNSEYCSKWEEKE